MKQAVIDLGSNSVLLTVVDGDTLLHDEARVVGLGKGLGDGGAFDSERMDAALIALKDYANTAEALGVPRREVKGIATSASRRASNASVFFDQVEAECGLKFRIISGTEEAHGSFEGASGGIGLNPKSTLLTIDLGGGSTEVVIGNHDRYFWWQSLEIGSARLTEDFLQTGGAGFEAMQAHIKKILEEIPTRFPAVAIIAMAGTATTLGAIDAGLTRWEAERVHGAELTREALQGLAHRLNASTPAERRKIAAVSPERAEFLVAGAMIIDGILARVGAKECILSVRGLRFGFLT
jgi:exopolyphosphatase / guanosine-5'-triphosphate,3'-diphosphate pyrophosphatase